jgi:hypothetical protein
MALFVGAGTFFGELEVLALLPVWQLELPWLGPLPPCTLNVGVRPGAPLWKVHDHHWWYNWLHPCWRVDLACWERRSRELGSCRGRRCWLKEVALLLPLMSQNGIETSI